MAPAAAPTPVPIRAPLPAPYPVPAPTAAPAPAPTAAPPSVPHAVVASVTSDRPITAEAILVFTDFVVIVPPPVCIRGNQRDGLVNNAGDGGPTKRVQEYTTDDWFYTINSCLTPSYMCTRFAVPEMIKAGGGVIVNVSSTAGRRGLPFRIGYCSAKAGQVGMTYGLALELAPHNIRVNAIAPGAVAGDRIDRVIAGQAEVRGVALEDMRRAFVERAPLKRMSTAEDIATLAVYLCSDAAQNLSGQCIAVTAGEPAV